MEAELADALSATVDKRSIVPLSVADIAKTAAQAGLDAAAFVAEVREKQIGALAANPVTLGMLLRLAAHGGLPDNRDDVYMQGVTLLADENNTRRRDERSDGPSVKDRVAAAEHLAALSLLGNRPSIVRRAPVPLTEASIALDEAASDAVPLDAVQAIWDSALLSAAGEGAQRWVHRSVAEYLTARRLTGLPLATVQHLLGSGGPERRVVPQLAEVAIWIATRDGEVFDWLAGTEPQVLLTAGLHAWTAGDRRKLTRALLAHLTEKHPFSSFHRYRGLDYPELPDDLRPYLAASQPNWVRREVLHMLAAAGRRELDTDLVRMIEALISGLPPEHYSDAEIGLAATVCFALEGTTDTEVVAGAHRILLDRQVSAHVRAALVPVVARASGWSAVLSALSADDVLASGRRLRSAVASELGDAIAASSVDVADVVAWLHRRRNPRLDDELCRLVGDTIAAIPEADAVDALTWGRIGSLCRDVDDSEARLFQRWSFDASVVPVAVRARVALETLRRSGGSFAVAPFVRREGLVRMDDLPTWIHQLASAIESQDFLATEAALAVLEHIAPPLPENIALAQKVRHERPALQDWFAEWSSPARVKAYRTATQPVPSPATPDTTPPVDADDLGAALDDADWPRIAELLRRPTITEPGHRHVHGSVLSEGAAWSLLDSEGVRKVLDLALAAVRGAEVSPSDLEALSDAYGVVAREQRGAFTSDDADAFASRVRHLFELPGTHAPMRATLEAFQPFHSTALDGALVEGIDGDRSRQHPVFTSRLGTYTSPQVTSALKRLCSAVDVHPYVLEDALPALLARDRDQGRIVGLGIVVDRPSATTPGSASNEEAAHCALCRLRRHRAAIAAVALLASSQASSVLDGLLAAMTEDGDFRRGVIRTGAPRDELRAWATLPPDDLATVYLWALRTLTRPEYEPGEAYSTDPEADFADGIHRMLTAQDSADAQAALDRIAMTTKNPWDRTAAGDMQRRRRAATWKAPSPAELYAILTAPRRRVIVSESDLAEVVLGAVDAVAEDVAADPDKRAMFWHRQTDSAHPVPLTENEFSTRLKLLLDPHLAGVSLRREVQLNEGQLGVPGARSDLEATVTDQDGEIVVITEAKADWHREVVRDLRAKLVKRYLATGRSRTGIYIAAWYDSPVGGGGKPRNIKRRPLGQLRRDLEKVASEYQDPSHAMVHVRVIDLSLPTAGDQGLTKH